MKKLWRYILGGIAGALVASASLIAQQSNIPLPASALPGTSGTSACYTTPQSGNPILMPCAGGGGSAQVLSNITYTQDSSTIVATWFTGSASNSSLVCGAKNAVDNNFQLAVTFHQAVVTGLSPATAYPCSVSSGSTTSTLTSVTTSAAPTRLAITSFLDGAPTLTSVHGDTLYNCVSNDNSTYITEDDGNGFTGSANAGANMQIGKLATESTLSGSLVNLLTSYGGLAVTNGTDGPGGLPASNKLNGMFCMGGILYALPSRNHYAGGGFPTQSAWYGNWIESADHGVTWNTFQNPTIISANGLQPSPLGTGMFATNLYGWVVPIKYAIDDGSLGYLTVGNRIDGGNAFVYMVSTDGCWNNCSNIYLTRTSRVNFTTQNPGGIQYWIGITPSVTSFVNDSNWSSSSTNATPIYTSSNQVSAPEIVFVPGLNTYLMITWYQPNVAVTSNSIWTILSGTTPAGPWTVVGTQTNSPQGWYNPTVLHRSVASNTVTNSIAIQLQYSGDYNNQAAYYYPTYSTVTLNPLPLLDAIGAGTATFAGSVAHTLRAAYAGPLIRVQRASDNTQSDIGQTNGLLNQTTLAAFCSGTTCNIAKLYDQSGSAHDALQATFAAMPIIYTGGAVVVNGVNNQPSMSFDGSGRFLASSITFAGNQFEAVGMTSITSGVVQFAGVAEMTDGTNSGGSLDGGANMLDIWSTAPTLASSQIANPVKSGCPVNPTISLATQFMWNSVNNMGTAAGSGSFLALNGGVFGSCTTNATSFAIAATVLDIGTDLPSNTYSFKGNISDLVVYSINLTNPQRSSAHAVESGFFGTP